MSGDVIKSFLVGLGFGVDDASLSKFNKAITSASLKVTALYGATKIASAGIVYGISKISEGFEQMGYEYRIIAPAINKALQLRKELLKAYAAAGINITKVIQSSVKLNFSLAKTKFAFEAIYKSVASRFFDLLTKQSDAFRQKIYANMPKIQAALERFVAFAFKALEATTALGLRLYSILSRVYDFFLSLDRATDGWSTIILGVVAAWKLLNLSFLATPLGMLFAGLTAVLALYDDFKTFQEGGKSLFDWGPVIPFINTVNNGLRAMVFILQAVSDAVGNVVLAFAQLFTGKGSQFFSSLKDAASSIGSIFTGHGGERDDFSLSNVAPRAAPLGAGPGSSQTNQHVQQQTNINVQGVADAGAVGKAVSGEQSKVNFDLVRNMKGSTR